MRPRGFVAVNAAADMAGKDRRWFREELQALHEQHGGVIFKKSPAPNAKQWTTWRALQKYMREEFGDVTQLDVLELREMILEDRKRLIRVEKKVNAK
jgi:hypothetical protein